MNKKRLTETDIRTKFITPALVGSEPNAKWDVMTQILEEYHFTKGRVIVRGKTVKRGESKKADYLLLYKPNLPLAVVEAKDNNHSVGAGMQQALEYAETLDIPFAYSSNGDAFLEHDRSGSGAVVEREIPLDQFAASRATAEKLLSALVAELTAPKAEVIDLHSSPEFIRAQLAAEIVDRQHGHSTFGQTKLQKVLYLAEYIFQLPEIDSRPRRFPRGPHDPDLIDQAERFLRDHEWFAVELRADGHGHRYRPLDHAGDHRDFFTRRWPDKASRIRALIDEMFTWNTERCERFATAYAAWNDLIIWGEKVTDATILREVLERWHPDKLNIPKSSWLETLQWMRDHNYIPTGFGHATTSAPQPEFVL